MSAQRKRKELELKDDFMFAKVIHDPDLCGEMPERLLNLKISGIEYPEEQKTINITYVDSKRIAELKAEAERKKPELLELDIDNCWHKFR